MPASPTALSLENKSSLVIEWSDGTRRRYAVPELRKACPCATCREKRGGGANTAEPTKQAGVLSLLPSGPRPEEVRIEGMMPVGHYAYAIAFSDGHDTGIYPLELLYELGTPA